MVSFIFLESAAHDRNHHSIWGCDRTSNELSLIASEIGVDYIDSKVVAEREDWRTFSTQSFESAVINVDLAITLSIQKPNIFSAVDTLKSTVDNWENLGGGVKVNQHCRLCDWPCLSSI